MRIGATRHKTLHVSGHLQDKVAHENGVLFRVSGPGARKMMCVLTLRGTSYLPSRLVVCLTPICAQHVVTGTLNFWS
jgi:hypothetical protein